MWDLNYLFHFSIFDSLKDISSSFVGPNRWITVALFTLSIIYFWKKHTGNYPPGPWGFPFVGYISFLKSKSHIKLTNLRESYGDIFSIKVGKHNLVVVAGFKGIMDGLSDKEIFSGRPNFHTNNLLFLGDKQRGIATADFDEKTMVKKTYLQESLDMYCTTEAGLMEQQIGEEALNLICYLLQQAEEVKNFNPVECLQFAHLHVMLSLLYDESGDTEEQSVDEIFRCLEERFITNTKQFCNFFPFFNPFHREHFDDVESHTRTLLRLQREILNRHKDTYNPNRLRDMVDQLLLFIEDDKDAGYIDSEEMDFLLFSVLGSGFGAVPTLLTWLIGYMVAFPEIQLQVQKELDDVVGHVRFPSLTDQAFLPFTSAVILEVQRIVTVYPFLQPHRTTQNCLFQGFDIPKDTLMLFNVWSLHHDNRHWKNPMKFDPNRFIDSDGSLYIPDFFMPYGYGSRQCPGESLVEIESFIFFTYLMHQLNFSSGAKGHTLHLEAEYSYILRPKPFKITVEPRECFEQF